MMEWFLPVVSAVFAAGGAYAAVRIELRFLWRDMHRHEQRIAELEAWRHGTPRRRSTDTGPRVRSDT